jgi:predicted nuclease of restriction endonuclease-like (RecB) superfamily
VQQPVAQLEEQVFMDTIVSKVGWSHHVILIDKTIDHAEKFWYLLNTLEHGISRNILAMQIDSQLFERQIKAGKVSNFQNTLPAPQTDLAIQMLKDPYIFDFVQAKDAADERDVERQLTEQITRFLLELGQGFAFVGRQMHFEIGDKDFYIDLLFYHIKLKAYVVIELKAGEFEPGDAGKLNFYLNLVNDKLRTQNENETIGLLLCKGKSKVLAEYALKSLKHPIGISDYQLSRAVPAELVSQLPTIDDLENELKEAVN